MKIAIISFPYLHFFGGAERYVDELAKAFTDNGDEVTIFTATSLFPQRKKRLSRHNIVTINTLLFFRKYKYTIENFFNFRVDMILRSSKYQDKFDLLLPQAIAARFILKNKNKYKAKIAVTSYNTPWPHYNKFEKSIYEKSDNVIAIHSTGKNKISANFNIDKEKIKIFPTGIDINRFHPRNKSHKIKSLYKLPESKKLVLTLQRMDGRKNLIELINAFEYLAKRNNDVVFAIAGGGPHKNSMIKYISKNSIKNVKILGFIEEKDLAKLYSTSDVFISATWGQVPLESMASGVATIILNADAPCLDYVHNNENGLLVENETGEIVSSVELLLKNADLRENLARNGRKFIEDNFDFSQIIKKYTKLL